MQGARSLGSTPRWGAPGGLPGLGLLGLGLLGGALLGCGAPGGGAPAGAPGTPLAAGAHEVVRYEAALRDEGVLDVVASFPAGSSSRFFLEPGAERFLRDLRPAADGTPSAGEPFVIPCGGGCELRYSFDLGAASADFDHVGYARHVGGAYLAPPSTWLLHPREGDLSRRFALEVKVPAGQHFVSGFPPAPSSEVSRREARGAGPEATPIVGAMMADLPGAPYAALGSMRVHHLGEAGASVDVAFVGPELLHGDLLAVGWVREASLDVAGLLGAPVAPHALVLIDVQRGHRFSLLTALGNGGASVHAPIGRAIDDAALAEDWRMTHEFVHLGAPSLSDVHDWLSEGLATYLEPLARVRRGRLEETELWADLVRSLPMGQPGPDDLGLDRTRTWGRTYWGGALFCLVADVEARRRTGNQRSLIDAVRAVHRAGGDMRARWSMYRWIEVADAAIGEPVLAELYATHRQRGVPVDLETLWAELGVVSSPSGAISFDEGAPLAALRRGISGR